MANNTVLKALLENELLTDDVKKSIEDAFNAIVEEQKQLAEEAAIKEAGEALNEALSEARAEMEAQVRTELATKFVAEREELVKSLDEKVKELLASEIEELKEDIDDFRDLEVELAAKLETEKEKLAEQFASEKKVFITKIDEFVTAELQSELQELHEDINAIKQNTFGKQMFESFVTMYEDSFADGDAHVASVKEKLAEAQAITEAAEERNKELEAQLAEMQRIKALENTLAPLSGKRRSVMESILNGFETDKFGTVYAKMIDRVMNTVPANAEETVTESEVESEDATVELDESDNVTVVDGNSRLEEESEFANEEDDELNENVDYSMLRKLAGIK